MNPSNKNKLITGILLFILLLSLVGNWILFNRGEQYYLLLNGVQLDPFGLGLYPSDAERPVLAEHQKLVVFFGDSRALHWPSPYNLPQFAFINRGGGGQTSEQIAGRYDEHVRALQPDFLIIQMCINDLKAIPLFPRQEMKIIGSCKENMQEIVSKSVEAETLVILTTIFPQGSIPLERRLFWSPAVAEAERSVNEFMHTLAGKNVIIFDTSEVLTDKNGSTILTYYEDFLHLNDTGYEALNNMLVDLLTNLEE